MKARFLIYDVARATWSLRNTDRNPDAEIVSWVSAFADSRKYPVPFETRIVSFHPVLQLLQVMDVFETSHLRINFYDNDTSIRDIAVEKVQSQTEATSKVRKVISFFLLNQLYLSLSSTVRTRRLIVCTCQPCSCTNGHLSFNRQMRLQDMMTLDGHL